MTEYQLNDEVSNVKTMMYYMPDFKVIWHYRKAGTGEEWEKLQGGVN